jgi:WD40 repeat protein
MVRTRHAFVGALALCAALLAPPTARADGPVPLTEANVLKLIDLVAQGGQDQKTRLVAWAPDFKTFAVGRNNEAVELWDVEAGKVRARLEGHPRGQLSGGFVYSLAFSPDGKTLAVGCYKHVLLWDVTTGKELATLKGHDWNVIDLRFTPDGKKLLTHDSHNWAYTGGEDNKARLWDVVERKVVFQAALGNADPAHHCLPLPDGKRLLVRGNNVSYLWSIGEMKPLYTARGGSDYVDTVTVFSPDYKTFAAGNPDGKVRLYETATGAYLADLNGHAGPVVRLAFSPDGKTLASGSDDKTAVLWDVATRKERAALKGHKGPLAHLLFSRDGKTLLTESGGETTLKLWDVATGEERGAIDKKGQSCIPYLSPDGKTLAVLTDGRLRLYDASQMLKAGN